MRKIRLDDGVFNRIVGNDREIPGYQRFVNLQEGLNSSPKIDQLVRDYEEMTRDHKNLFGTLASLEDLITLMRIRENLDIQLYTQREYIYARQACPRDTKNRDIRVCVGRIDDYKVKDVLLSPKVMSKAKNIVTENLDVLIDELKDKMDDHLISLNLQTI